MEFKLVMGNRVYSGWSLRVWLAIKQLGIEFDHEVVPLYTDEFDEFRKAFFPARQLPALVATEDGKRQVIWDSLSIIEFLNECFPDAGLWPVNRWQRATARSLCTEMHSGFKALRSKMPMNLRRRYTDFKPDEETVTDIERICKLWKWSRAEFKCEGPYLLGEKLSAVDAFFAPVATRFRTYSISLDDQSRAYSNLLLQHPAMVEFVEAAQSEEWVMAHNEFHEG